MRAVPIEEAEREGFEKGRTIGLRFLRGDEKYLRRYASGEEERRHLRHHFYLMGHRVARLEPEHFGKHDSRQRDEKFEIYAQAFAKGAMEEAHWEAEKRGVEVA